MIATEMELKDDGTLEKRYCYNICQLKNIGFCGKLNCVYDIYCEPCTWTSLEFVERKYDEDPPKYRGKGHLIGLSVWDVLNSISGNYDAFDLNRCLMK
jgi:hypothetical protein